MIVTYINKGQIYNRVKIVRDDEKMSILSIVIQRTTRQYLGKNLEYVQLLLNQRVTYTI